MLGLSDSGLSSRSNSSSCWTESNDVPPQAQNAKKPYEVKSADACALYARYAVPDAVVDFDWSEEAGGWHLLCLTFSSPEPGIKCFINGVCVCECVCECVHICVSVCVYVHVCMCV